MTPRPSSLLTSAAIALLMAGVGARFLLGDDLNPLVESFATALMLLGGGLALLCGVMEGRAPAPILVVLVVVLMLPAASPMESFTIKRAADVLAATVAGLALMDLVSVRRMGNQVRRVLVAAAIALSWFGIAQSAWLNASAEAAARAVGHALTKTERGEAFLHSWRAAATFTSANHFAGFLLLVAPAVVGAWLRGRRRAAASIAAISCVAAFACAGSAGGAGALAIGGCVATWRMSPPGTNSRRRWRIASAGVALVGLGIVILASAHVGGGKLATLAERLDYHRLALRVLAEHVPFGCGLEATRTWMSSAHRAGEAFSRSPHDWWLQGLVECGIVFFGVAAILVRVVWRSLQAPQTEPVGDGDPPSRVVAWGLLGGVLLSAALAPFVTFLPATAGIAQAVDAGVTLAVLAGAWCLAGGVATDSPGFRSGLRVGLAAFLVHGFLDSDLLQPGVMITLALVLSAVRGPASQDVARTSGRVATIGLGLAAILAAVPIVQLGAGRQLVADVVIEGPQTEITSDHLDQLFRAPLGPIPDLRAAAAVWPDDPTSAQAIAMAQRIADSWSRGIRRRPDARALIDRLERLKAR